MREARHTENGLRQQTAHPAGESSAGGRLHRALEDIRSGSNYLLGWISIAMTVLFLLIGLWPLTFSPTNNASWLSTTNGLHFPGAKARSPFDPGGLAFTPEPLIVPSSEHVQPGALTIQMQLRPTHQPGGAKERILSLCDTEGRERFFIGQWSTELLLFVPTGKDLTRSAYREFDLSREFKAGRTFFVTITSDPTATLAYMDGKLVKRLENVSLLLAHQTVAGERLFLGNSPNGLHAWAGDVFGLALYGRALGPRQLAESRLWWSHGRGKPPTETASLIALYDFSAGTGEQVDNPGWVPRAVSFSAGFMCAAPNHPISQRIVADMAEHNRINAGHCPAFRLGLGLLTASFHQPVTLVPPDWIFPRRDAEYCLMRYVEGAYKEPCETG